MAAEMTGDMPSSDEAYAATDALVCEGYLLGTNEEPRASLATSMEWLMGDDWNPVHHHGLSTLNLFAFLNCKCPTLPQISKTLANPISIKRHHLCNEIELSLQVQLGSHL